MLSQKQAEEEMVSRFNETEHEEKEEDQNKGDDSIFSLKSILWHGGSVYDAWFSCASNQVLIEKSTKNCSNYALLVMCKLIFNQGFFFSGSYRLLRFY